MAKYDDEVDTALELITEFGGEFVIRDPKAIDVTQWPPFDANDDHIIIGVLIVEHGREYGKTIFYSAAKDIPVVPKPGMLILKDGLIVGSIDENGVDELNPDGSQPILYTCRLSPWLNQTI